MSGQYSTALARCCPNLTTSQLASLGKISSSLQPVKDDLGLKTGSILASLVNAVRSTLNRQAIISITDISIWNIQRNQLWWSIVSATGTAYRYTTVTSSPSNQNTWIASSGRWMRPISIM
jgi:hypothetical protein